MLAVSLNASTCSAEPFQVFSPLTVVVPETVWYAIVFGSLEFVLEQDAASAAISQALHEALVEHFQIEPRTLFITKLLLGGQSQPLFVPTRRLALELQWSAQYQAVVPMRDAAMIEQFVAGYSIEDDTSNTSFFALFQLELQAAGVNATLHSLNFTDIQIRRVSEAAANNYLASLLWQSSGTADNTSINGSGGVLDEFAEFDSNQSSDSNMTSDMTFNISSRNLAEMLLQAGC